MGDLGCYIIKLRTNFHLLLAVYSKDSHSFLQSKNDETELSRVTTYLITLKIRKKCILILARKSSLFMLSFFGAGLNSIDQVFLYLPHRIY